MTATRPTTTTAWAWIISTPIISLFISIFLSMFPYFEFSIKLIIVSTVLCVWFLFLFVAYVLDIQKRKMEMLREICQEDAFIKKWGYYLKINPDGSAIVRREIHAINFGEKRRKFEFESWTDPERNRRIEREIRKARTMRTEVTVIPKKKPPIKIFSSKDIVPIEGHKVNRIVHSIPLTDPPNKPDVPYLSPDDEFRIVFSEKHEVGTWKIRGDKYRHRISHATELMHVKMTFPSNWTFPQESTDNVVGWVKAPTSGKWERTEEQPKMQRGNTVVWDIRHPRLMYIYKLQYSKMATT